MSDEVSMLAGPTVLVVDDEELIRWSLAQHLRGQGMRVVEARDGGECLEVVAREEPDLVIIDLKMPDIGGVEVLRRLREDGRELPAIVLTAHGTVGSAVEATRLGARAVLHKPFDLDEVGAAVHTVLERHRLETEIRYLRGRQRAAYGQLIGESPAMLRLFETLRRLEDIDAPTVLILGESGTGKDLIARALHAQGPRRDGPLMEVDCASLPEQLIESELFGHERGAFTDAKRTKRGLFEVARGGTIFLDEIGEMPVTTQSRLLRALESRRFKRVGGVSDIQLDAGVVAASNRNLLDAVRQGSFREDLFFRLNVIRVEVPPLRDRREDIPLLVEHFVQRFNRDFRRHVHGLSAEAMARLQAHAWSGNVRELRNIVERMVILEDVQVLQARHLPAEIRYGVPSPETLGAFVLPEGGVRLDDVERGLILQAIERTQGNQSAAARLLGISRFALRYRMKKHGLPGGRSGA